MTKFKTPVAMRVTKEQGKYLGEELTKLGYFEAVRENSGYISTNWNGIHSQFAIHTYKPEQRFVIEEYNPELFLAIAAMTEGDIPIKGEWLYYDGLSKIFQVKSFDTYNDWESGQITLSNPTGLGHFHKPTILQLEKHFKNSNKEEEFTLPEHWCVIVTDEILKEVEQWKNHLGVPILIKVGYITSISGTWGDYMADKIRKSYTEITSEQFLKYVYEPAFKQEIPKEFYVRYCEGFTEDIFNELRLWSAENGDVGGESTVFSGYAEFIRQDKPRYFLFERDCPNGDWSFGINDIVWDNIETEYTLEQVKKLINYKPKTNSNEYKENNCKKEFRENEQINEDLDRNSSSKRGKEVKTRIKCSRNLCERGSFSSTEKVARTRRTSFRVRAEERFLDF